MISNNKDNQKYPQRVTISRNPLTKKYVRIISERITGHLYRTLSVEVIENGN